MYINRICLYFNGEENLLQICLMFYYVIKIYFIHTRLYLSILNTSVLEVTHVIIISFVDLKIKIWFSPEALSYLNLLITDITYKIQYV